MRVSQSIDDQVPETNKYRIEDNSIFRITWQRRASIGLFYRFFINRSGSEYEPGIGFYRANNTSDYFYRLGFGWLGNENSIYRQHSVNIGSFNIFQNETFDLRSRFISLEWNTDFKTIGSVEFQTRFNQEYLLPDEDFNLLSEIFIPVNNYDFFESSLNYRSPNSRRIQTDLGLEFGSFYDGTRTQFSIEPRIVASLHFEFGGSYSITKLDYPEIDGRSNSNFTAHLAQLKGQYALNKKLSTSAFIQYSNVEELVGANIRFRYNFKEGRDIWIVVNEQIYTERDQFNRGLPNLPSLQSRSILIKYNHTFSF